MRKIFDIVLIICLVTLAIYSIVDRVCKTKEQCALYTSLGKYLDCYQKVKDFVNKKEN